MIFGGGTTRIYLKELITKSIDILLGPFMTLKQLKKPKPGVGTPQPDLPAASKNMRLANNEAIFVERRFER